MHKGKFAHSNRCLLLSDIKNTKEMFNELVELGGLENELKQNY